MMLNNDNEFIFTNRFMKSKAYTSELKNIMMKLYSSVTTGSKTPNGNGFSKILYTYSINSYLDDISINYRRIKKSNNRVIIQFYRIV